jgi:hypothetical protein
MVLASLSWIRSDQLVMIQVSKPGNSPVIQSWFQSLAKRTDQVSWSRFSSVTYFMSRRPTYYTYWNHADFPNVSVFPGDFEFSGIVCN